MNRRRLPAAVVEKAALHAACVRLLSFRAGFASLRREFHVAMLAHHGA